MIERKISGFYILVRMFPEHKFTDESLDFNLMRAAISLIGRHSFFGKMQTD